MYGAYHWLFPVASRKYILVDGNRRIVFERKMAVLPLENQAETLLREIDAHVIAKCGPSARWQEQEACSGTNSGGPVKNRGGYSHLRIGNPSLMLSRPASSCHVHAYPRSVPLYSLS
jgi:hypothetical protein